MTPGSRSRRTYGALLFMVFLTACAGNGPQRGAPTSGTQSAPAATSEPRSTRGNPPFYDVLGKRYHVLPTSAGYRQRGVASWYGRDFHGLSTSSGETYDMHAMTAAHTTLPIPTWVEVTNLSNGKTVVVKVNDRGPFVDNRLIDLSFAAATVLDMVQNGTTRVEVRAIGAPIAAPPVAATVTQSAPTAMMSAPRPAASGAPAPPAPAAAAAAAERMFVQVGAFSERDNATRLVQRLRASGFVDPVVVIDGEGRRTLHRVRLGPIRDSREFDELSARLRDIGVPDARLVVGP